MPDTPVMVFTTRPREVAARRLLASACQATGVPARLEAFESNGSLFARISAQREGPRGDLLLSYGPYLAQTAANQGILDVYQPPRLADRAPHHPDWRWAAADALPWSATPAVQRLDDLLAVPALAMADPTRSEAGMTAVLASLDRARQMQGDPEAGWQWWQQRVASGLRLTENAASTAMAVREGRATHALMPGPVDGGGLVSDLAPAPNAMGLLAGSRNADAARRLLAWLLGPDAAASETDGLSFWQATSNGLGRLPSLDVAWTLGQYRAVRDRWLTAGWAPA